MPCKHCSCPLYYARMGYQPVGFRLFNPAATELLSKFLCLPPLELCQYVLLEGNRRVAVFESLKSGVVYDIQRSPKIAAIDGCDVLAKFDQIIQTDGLEIVKNLEMDLDGGEEGISSCPPGPSIAPTTANQELIKDHELVKISQSIPIENVFDKEEDSGGVEDQERPDVEEFHPAQPQSSQTHIDLIDSIADLTQSDPDTENLKVNDQYANDDDGDLEVPTQSQNSPKKVDPIDFKEVDRNAEPEVLAVDTTELPNQELDEDFNVDSQFVSQDFGMSQMLDSPADTQPSRGVELDEELDIPVDNSCNIPIISQANVIDTSDLMITRATSDKENVSVAEVSPTFRVPPQLKPKSQSTPILRTNNQTALKPKLTPTTRPNLLTPRTQPVSKKRKFKSLSQLSSSLSKPIPKAATQPLIISSDESGSDSSDDEIRLAGRKKRKSLMARLERDLCKNILLMVVSSRKSRIM